MDRELRYGVADKLLSHTQSVILNWLFIC